MSDIDCHQQHLQGSVSEYCAQYYYNEEDFSPIKYNYFENNEKRDNDALDEELSNMGLVYLVKNPQQKREPNRNKNKRSLKKRIDYLNNYTVYNKPLMISYNSTEQYNAYTEELLTIFINPPQAVLNEDGWPPKEIYDPALDTLYWWRNDPVVNQHHELWHVVMVSTIVDGARKDREGENFIYMHRHMVARYDAERLGVGLEIVEALPDYRTPIKEAFYPNPFLTQDNDTDASTPRVWFVARPSNESMKDMVQLMGTTFFIYKLSFLERTYEEILKWIDHNYTEDHPVQLGWNDSEANTLGSNVELVLHNIGHSVLGYIMHPYSIGCNVLVGARGGLRDPLFWRWHRHLDSIYLRFQNKLGPNNFSDDSPNVTIRTTDIFLSFTDVLLETAPDGKADGWQAFGDKTFGGDKFDTDLSNLTVVTSELQTKMKNRTYTWLEDNFDKENITYVFPRDWQYFFRVENNVGITSIITIRIFIVPAVLANSTTHWIELDKFKRALKPYEKAVIPRACDKAVVIRKPAQKNETSMDSTAITAEYRTYLTQFSDKEVAEKEFCNCGWPYNMIIPRGTKEGMKFKMIVFISDGLNDLVPTFDQCGSTLLCGAHKWEDKIPDSKPMGYPFNRPFKDGSYEKTFAGLNNVAIRDFTIKLVSNFTEVD
ncbi:2944_t:CDS:2 [Diversispora eburnea]|uniref:2944_t:CDS:1 n=1 Tax=Diversispora eburnea TaxID=1213867 RepID=A0A9N8V0H2_9GLOM|nr:2944_t:CDS:2 [Diversispora eburnea]